MKLFLDTANLKEIQEVASLGVLDGVTTNPTLVAREQGDFETIIRQICEVVDGPVNAEVVSTEAKKMIEEGRILRKIHENVVVKIPMIAEGLKAIKALSSEGTPTNCTLVFSTTQAILAAKAGASFVSPFVGRIDDISGNGMDLVREIMAAYENYPFDTEVLVASIRNPTHVVEAALAGADISSMPSQVFWQMLKHPLTDIGLERFLADWEKAKLAKDTKKAAK